MLIGAVCGQRVTSEILSAIVVAKYFDARVADGEGFVLPIAQQADQTALLQVNLDFLQRTRVAFAADRKCPETQSYR